MHEPNTDTYSASKTEGRDGEGPRNPDQGRHERPRRRGLQQMSLREAHRALMWVREDACLLLWMNEVQ